MLDDFEDVHAIDQAQALLRGRLQELPAEIPLIIMGSKQHLLAAIFSRPRAPFASWGSHCAFGVIPYQEYQEYMNERFQAVGLTKDLDAARYLQDKMSRNPEAINRVCHRIMYSTWSQATISTAMIDAALEDLVVLRASEPERYLGFVSEPRIKGDDCHRQTRSDQTDP